MYFRPLCLALIVVLVTASSASLANAAKPAKATEKPFKGRLDGIWDNVFNGLFAPPANFVGEGQVSHMGRTQQEGWLVLDPPTAPDQFLFTGHGEVTFTAANGDELTFEYEGVLNALTGEGIGTITFIGGTGRFAGATGEGTFHAFIDVSDGPQGEHQSMYVELDGKVRY